MPSSMPEFEATFECYFSFWALESLFFWHLLTTEISNCVETMGINVGLFVVGLSVLGLVVMGSFVGCCVGNPDGFLVGAWVGGKGWK